MALSSFSDKTNPPTKAELRSALGDAYPLWTSLLALIGERIDAITEVWGYAEGRGIRLEVKSGRQLPSLATLAEIKWKN